MAKVTKAREFTVQIPNKVGSLAELLRATAEAGVNVVAFCGESRGRKGLIRLVASDAAKAGRTLKKAGYDAEKSDVLVVELPDGPGVGARLTERLAEAGVNIKSTYAADVAGRGLIVLNVDNRAAASRALRRL